MDEAPSSRDNFYKVESAWAPDGRASCARKIDANVPREVAQISVGVNSANFHMTYGFSHWVTQQTESHENASVLPLDFVVLLNQIR